LLTVVGNGQQEFFSCLPLLKKQKHWEAKGWFCRTWKSQITSIGVNKFTEPDQLALSAMKPMATLKKYSATGISAALM